jgi:hypothetical protein
MLQTEETPNNHEGKIMNNRVPGVSAENSIPILIKTKAGYVELLLSFISSDNIENFPSLAKDCAVEVDGRWVVPGITGARILLGPLMENVPAGDGGVPIKPEIAQQIAESIDLPGFLSRYRGDVEDDSVVAQIIDAFLQKYRGY